MKTPCGILTVIQYFYSKGLMLWILRKLMTASLFFDLAIQSTILLTFFIIPNQIYFGQTVLLNKNQVNAPE